MRVYGQWRETTIEALTSALAPTFISGRGRFRSTLPGFSLSPLTPKLWHIVDLAGSRRVLQKCDCFRAVRNSEIEYADTILPILPIEVLPLCREGTSRRISIRTGRLDPRRAHRLHGLGAIFADSGRNGRQGASMAGRNIAQAEHKWDHTDRVFAPALSVLTSKRRGACPRRCRGWQ